MRVPLKSSSSKKAQRPATMTIDEILLPHFPRSGVSPKIWIWSPSKPSLSYATICGSSPAVRRDGLGRRLLGHGQRRPKEQRHQEQHRLFHPCSPSGAPLPRVEARAHSARATRPPHEPWASAHGGDGPHARRPQGRGHPCRGPRRGPQVRPRVPHRCSRVSPTGCPVP